MLPKQLCIPQARVCSCGMELQKSRQAHVVRNVVISQKAQEILTHPVEIGMLFSPLKKIWSLFLYFSTITNGLKHQTVESSADWTLFNTKIYNFPSFSLITWCSHTHLARVWRTRTVQLLMKWSYKVRPVTERDNSAKLSRLVNLCLFVSLQSLGPSVSLPLSLPLQFKAALHQRVLSIPAGSCSAASTDLQLLSNTYCQASEMCNFSFAHCRPANSIQYINKKNGWCYTCQELVFICLRVRVTARLRNT